MKAHKLISLSFFIFVASLLFVSERAEAISCREWGRQNGQPGVYWDRSTGRCAGFGRQRTPRYVGRGNKGCNDMRPAAVNIAGIRAANPRVPYMRPEIFRYVKALNAKCSLTVQSTYRDCGANRRARGVSRSRHLCGGAADTSCGGGTSKGIARSVCRAQGLVFIDEGASRYPHCQIPGSCN